MGVSLAGQEVLTVVPRAASAALTLDDCGVVSTNSGAAAEVVFQLPAAVLGYRYLFAVGAAFELRIEPAGVNQIVLPSTGVPGAAGKYLVADVIGAFVELACLTAGVWSVTGFTGVWTAEA